MLIRYTSAALIATLSVLASAAGKTYVVELVDGINAANIFLNPTDHLTKILGPHIKKSITIGAFNCLIAELEDRDALALNLFPSVKAVMPDAFVKIVDAPSSPLNIAQNLSVESNALTSEPSFKVQIEDLSLLNQKIPEDGAASSTTTDEIKSVPAKSWDKEKPTQTQEDAPLHLVRINTREGFHNTNSPDMSYTYEHTGAGVHVYVIDSGIQIEHPDFEGRAIRGANFVPDEGPGDMNGHGTHVAGLIGSKTYGVAKDLTIVEVKALSGKGQGAISAILEAMQWAANDRQSKGHNGVLNMSLGGFFYSILNDAADAVKKSGMSIVVAAGNEKTSAALFSPASAPEAITVAAMNDKKDTIAWFSNFGDLVDVFAPGFEVLSLNAKDFDTPIQFSGTSMASPIVAGVVAVYMEEGISVDQMKSELVERSTRGALSKSLRKSWRYYSTPDRLVYVGPPTETNTVSAQSPFTDEDINSQTVMPSFGQFTMAHETVKELSYEAVQ
ncbi:CYFA0S01e16556g1_1 [Cyberlindnera fabianii]|uniref:CYFA0S01e16556g1_1 n=1 Tax=Cyberlindnera fabianii TaxID=36022 RepID=A0A061ASQ6_CYBFA|nr:CYFA0S01e16556g1_1 [Cyberlindnera fabianii]